MKNALCKFSKFIYNEVFFLALLCRLYALSTGTWSVWPGTLSLQSQFTVKTRSLYFRMCSSDTGSLKGTLNYRNGRMTLGLLSGVLVYIVCTQLQSITLDIKGGVVGTRGGGENHLKLDPFFHHKQKITKIQCLSVYWYSK